MKTMRVSLGHAGVTAVGISLASIAASTTGPAIEISAIGESVVDDDAVLQSLPGDYREFIRREAARRHVSAMQVYQEEIKLNRENQALALELMPFLRQQAQNQTIPHRYLPLADEERPF